MKSPVTYPFEPKSTKNLIPGQFWPIRISDGRYCCGRIIRLFPDVPQWRSRGFLAGLMDWVSARPPDEESLVGCRTLEQGFATIKSIRETGPMITGFRDLVSDHIEPNLFITFVGTDAKCFITDGYHHLRAATEEERKKLKQMPGWGFLVIKQLAERLFGNRGRDKLPQSAIPNS